MAWGTPLSEYHHPYVRVIAGVNSEPHLVMWWQGMTAALFIRVLWLHINIHNNSSSNSMAHRLQQLCLLTIVYVAAAVVAAVAVILVAIFLGKYQIHLFLPALHPILVSNIFNVHVCDSHSAQNVDCFVYAVM